MYEPKQGSQVLWVRCKHLRAPVPQATPDTSKTPDESPKWSIHYTSSIKALYKVVECLAGDKMLGQKT